MNTSLSIAIRSVKVNDYLHQLLESVYAQTYRPSEIIIAVPRNETTPDQRWTSLAEKYNNIPLTVVECEKGMVSQRSSGLVASNSELVLLLDDDLILPPTFVEKMVEALTSCEAVAAVPYFRGAYPTSKARRFFMCVFGMCVPYKGSGGTKQLLTGGFKYPTKELNSGEAADTDGGIGHAILVDRKWVLANGSTGDMRLQSSTNSYALREDGAFIYSQKIAGGRTIMVNVGDYIHLAGTTRLSPHRRVLEFDASIYNNFVYWRYYVYQQQSGIRGKTLAVLGIARHLIGVGILSCVSVIKNRTFTPFRGIFVGWVRLLRSLLSDV